MELIYLGKIVSTHGIKGEIKIKSNFQYKERAFKIGNKIIINNNLYQINSYRRHKDFEMITLYGYNDINQVLFLLKQKVFINKEQLQLNNLLLDEDLLNFEVIINNKKGKILEIFFASKTNKIIRILVDNKEILVPYVDEFIEKINQKDKKIYIKTIDGMIE